MEIIGLGINPKIRAYLADVRRVESEPFGDFFQFSSVNEVRLGGFKEFYSVVLSRSIGEIVALFKKKNGNFSLNLATRENTYSSRLKTFLLNLEDTKEKSDVRFLLYSKKTRNQVKKAFDSALTLSVSPVMGDAYEVYSQTIENLGNKPRTKEWFTDLEGFLGSDILCFTASIGQNIVGVNYAIRSGDYILLMFNASTKEGKELNVNNFLYDALVKWSIENGLIWVDFGTSVEKDTSHIHFKLGFGAEEWYLSQKEFGTAGHRLSKWISQKRYNHNLRRLKNQHREPTIGVPPFTPLENKIWLIIAVIGSIVLIASLYFVYHLK